MQCNAHTHTRLEYVFSLTVEHIKMLNDKMNIKCKFMYKNVHRAEYMSSFRSGSVYSGSNMFCDEKSVTCCNIYSQHDAASFIAHSMCERYIRSVILFQ